MSAGEYDCVIVGAGAAGLMAAIQVANGGKRVVVLERMQKPALKMRITGKGRCNITNAIELSAFIQRFGKNGRFLKFAFNQFFNDDLLSFLHELGVETKLERGGRYFPVSDTALEIVRALVRAAEQAGAEILTHAEARGIVPLPSGGFTVDILDGRQLTAGKVLLATGGRSYPRTGSDGAGYRLAKALGHHIVDQHPSLVALVTAGPEASRMQGLSLRNVTASIWEGERKREEAFGEMLFTRDGVSGPIILSLSRFVVPWLKEGHKLELSLDLKPALDHQTLDRRLLRDIEENSKQQIDKLFKRLLPRKLIPVIIERLGLPPNLHLHQVTGDDRKAIRLLLKDFRLVISGHEGWETAIVTAGGIDLREVNPQTMESKLVPGLYIAGEILDLDADTGGFNLQAAFSTGWLAGRACLQG